jgi:hypothetical protein
METDFADGADGYDQCTGVTTELRESLVAGLPSLIGLRGAFGHD